MSSAGISESIAAGMLRQFTILYVEDDLEAQEELARFLRRRCARLILASDGADGIEMYHRHQPDMVVTDIRMPRMNGIDMALEIKQSDPDIPIIVTTAHNDVGYLRRCIEAGVDRYVFKPTDLDELLDALQRNAGILTRRLRERDEELTRARERENELNLLRREAEAAAEAKSKLLADVSHEFRTPLGAILGFTRLAMEENRGDQLLMSRLGVVHRHGENLLRMVDNLLEFQGAEKAGEEHSDWERARLDRDILLADDGMDNRLLISTMLRKHGARVAHAEDGEQAVASVLRAWKYNEPFHLVLMDMRMPKLDGYAATRRLREEGYPGKIIALTAQATPDDRAKCLACGCDEYITKPVRRRELMETLLKISAELPS